MPRDTILQLGEGVNETANARPANSRALCDGLMVDFGPNR
jgi:hypothetical protein